MGGCGDDGFDYFKSWIISQGQTAYLAFLENADNLIDFLPEDPEDMECEELDYAPLDAWERLTGKDWMSHAPLAEISELAARPETPAGKDWDEDDTEDLSKRFPRLWAKFGWQS